MRNQSIILLGICLLALSVMLSDEADTQVSANVSVQFNGTAEELIQQICKEHKLVCTVEEEE